MKIFAEKRRADILELLKEMESVDVGFLARHFHTSATTIRRDLRTLQLEDRLVRTHGGALAERYAGVFSFEEETAHLAEKRRIVKVAASMIAPGDVIALDSGSTTRELARIITGREPLSVITNSLPIALELSRRRGIEIQLLGGSLKRDVFSTEGPLAVENIGRLFCDKAFLGLSGLSAQAGITDPTVLTAEIKRSMIRAARELIVVTDHTKIGKVCMSFVASAQAIHKLVVDDGIRESDKAAFESLGVQVIVC